MYLAKTDHWYIERVVYMLAGLFTLAGVSLGILVHPYWFALNVLVGINLLIFSLTGFCIMTNILYKMGVRPQCSNQ